MNTAIKNEAPQGVSSQAYINIERHSLKKLQEKTQPQQNTQRLKEIKSVLAEDEKCYVLSEN